MNVILIYHQSENMILMILTVAWLLVWIVGVNIQVPFLSEAVWAFSKTGKM